VVATSRGRIIKLAGAALAAAFLGFVGAAQAYLAPSAPDQCEQLASVTKTANCLRVFAKRRGEEAICRAIAFRTTRFACSAMSPSPNARAHSAPKSPTSRHWRPMNRRRSRIGTVVIRTSPISLRSGTMHENRGPRLARQL